MKNLKINLAFLYNDFEKGRKFYLNYLINVIVAYLLVKGGNVMISPNSDKVNAVLCLDNVLISLRDFFGEYSFPYFAQLDYYLQIFLNQDVIFNKNFDEEMMKVFGPLSPRVVIMSDDIYVPCHESYIFDAFFDGIDPINKQYILDWNQRIVALDNWLQTKICWFQSTPHTLYDVEQQELFELAVINIEKQPEAPYYLFFHEKRTGIALKLTKQQYLRVLWFYIYTYKYWKTNDFYRDILKGGANNIVIEGQEMGHMTLQAHFPQIFPEFDLQTWDIVNDFNLSDLINSNLLPLIFKPYFAKLIFKHFEYLNQHTTFFSTHSEYFKDITYDLDQITTMVNSIPNRTLLWFWQFFTNPLFESICALKAKNK